MREHLGWVTNCEDETGCPQNWVEHATQELPCRIQCHVCGREVQAVSDESHFKQIVNNGETSALPVVPVTGMGASYSTSLFGNVASTGMPDAAPRETNPPQPARTLFCVLSNGEEVPLDKERMILGRSRTCDIVVPSAKVSRQHASLTLEGGVYYIEDLGSANGVWRDGERINGRAPVNDGDVFSVSEENLVFQAR